MIDPLESLKQQLSALGYSIKLHWQQHRKQWECELLAPIAVLPTELPRPRAFGATWQEAVQGADALRLELEAELKKRKRAA